MALSMLKPGDATPNTGIAVHHLRRGMKDKSEDAEPGSPESPPQNATTNPLDMFPTSLLAQHMLGNLGLGGLVPPTWFPPQTSPPTTPEVSSTSGKSKKRKGKTLVVDTLPPEPPLSPPTSGSSPQSNGSNGESRQFTCGICNRSFGYKHVLQNHERTHTGEKPFECNLCHKRFTRDHHLKTHMRLHTGEKPYHCTHCDRQFVQVANLRRHLRVHTGERPYACELCGAKFSDSNQLKAHLLIHKGEKPFECVACGGTYRRRHHLLHHKCSRAANREQSEDSDAEQPLTINNNIASRRKSRDIRRVVRDEPLEEEDEVHVKVEVEMAPEQTEPEDLSLPKSKLRSQLTGSPQSYQEQKYRQLAVLGVPWQYSSVRENLVDQKKQSTHSFFIKEEQFF